MLGLIAEGGLVFTVDLVVELLVTVLLLVLFVTIGSAAFTTVGITNVTQNTTTTNPAIKLLRSLSDIKV
jgi:uncharacterized membrane protein YjgN (DUF898 family)